MQGFTSSIIIAQLLGTLNKPMITSFGIQCSAMKFTTNTNVLKLVLNIQRLKVMVLVAQLPNVGKTYVTMVSTSKLGM
jgi:hypothetical protein